MLAAPAFRGLGDELFGEVREALVVLRDVVERRQGFVVEIREIALEIVGDDLLPAALAAARTLPQDFGVVDLPELDRTAAGGSPLAGDAAIPTRTSSGARASNHQKTKPFATLEVADDP